MVLCNDTHDPLTAGVAKLVDATDSKPVVARHESSSLSPGTSEKLNCRIKNGIFLQVISQSKICREHGSCWDRLYYMIRNKNGVC